MRLACVRCQPLAVARYDYACAPKNQKQKQARKIELNWDPKVRKGRLFPLASSFDFFLPSLAPNYFTHASGNTTHGLNPCLSVQLIVQPRPELPILDPPVPLVSELGREERAALRALEGNVEQRVQDEIEVMLEPPVRVCVKAKRVSWPWTS